jgi:hypothetical protein
MTLEGRMISFRTLDIKVPNHSDKWLVWLHSPKRIDVTAQRLAKSLVPSVLVLMFHAVKITLELVGSHHADVRCGLCVDSYYWSLPANVASSHPYSQF